MSSESDKSVDTSYESDDEVFSGNIPPAGYEDPDCDPYRSDIHERHELYSELSYKFCVIKVVCLKEVLGLQIDSGCSSSTTILQDVLNLKLKMSQSDHTSNFHDYVIISVHIRLFFVSVAQFFAKLILSVAQFLYHKVF